MGTGIGSFMAVEGPARLPTRRTAKRTAPAAAAQAGSVSRSPGTTGDAGVSLRAASRRRATSAKRLRTDPTRSAPASVRERRAAVTSRKTSAELTVRELIVGLMAPSVRQQDV